MYIVPLEAQSKVFSLGQEILAHISAQFRCNMNANVRLDIANMVLNLSHHMQSLRIHTWLLLRPLPEGQFSTKV